MKLLGPIQLKVVALFQPGDNGTFMDLNLFNASGEHWKMLRHTMSPTFSTGKIKAVSKHVFHLKSDVSSKQIY